jgi:hypothetical protein
MFETPPDRSAALQQGFALGLPVVAVPQRGHLLLLLAEQAYRLLERSDPHLAIEHHGLQLQHLALQCQHAWRQLFRAQVLDARRGCGSVGRFELLLLRPSRQCREQNDRACGHRVPPSVSAPAFHKCSDTVKVQLGCRLRGQSLRAAARILRFRRAGRSAAW